MSRYLELVAQKQATINKAGSAWTAINGEYAARMELQNRFKTGLDIARYTADIMRKDMADYDADSSNYTQSLGCWHGFTAQQMMMAVKRHRKTTDKSYVYLSGWMVAALRSDFGPLPDQSMHEKTAVSGLIEEIYTFCVKRMRVNCAICLKIWMMRVLMAVMWMPHWLRLIITKHILCLLSLILMLALVMRKQRTFWQSV